MPELTQTYLQNMSRVISGDPMLHASAGTSGNTVLGLDPPSPSADQSIWPWQLVLRCKWDVATSDVLIGETVKISNNFSLNEIDVSNTIPTARPTNADLYSIRGIALSSATEGELFDVVLSGVCYARFSTDGTGLLPLGDGIWLGSKSADPYLHYDANSSLTNNGPYRVIKAEFPEVDDPDPAPADAWVLVHVGSPAIENWFVEQFDGGLIEAGDHINIEITTDANGVNDGVIIHVTPGTIGHEMLDQTTVLRDDHHDPYEMISTMLIGGTDIALALDPTGETITINADLTEDSFSGDHADLTNVTTSQHHDPYTQVASIVLGGTNITAVLDATGETVTLNLDQLTHDYLTGVTTSQHHDPYTEVSGILVGGDNITLALDAVAETITINAVVDAPFSGDHDDLTNVTTSQHHVKYTDAEAITAINTDIDHGSTAQHDYFSGDHADLTNVTTSQHHDPYDEVSTMIVGGDNITVALDAVAETITINAADFTPFSGNHADLTNVTTSQHHHPYTEVSGMLVGGTDITLSLDPTGETITINADLTAGSFSGDHADLTNVTTSQHHVKYTDAEARDAMANQILGGTGIDVAYDALAQTHTVSLEHLGLEGMTAPGSDLIYYYDFSAGTSAWLLANDALGIDNGLLNVVVASYSEPGHVAGTNPLGINIDGLFVDWANVAGFDPATDSEQYLGNSGGGVGWKSLDTGVELDLLPQIQVDVNNNVQVRMKKIKLDFDATTGSLKLVAGTYGAWSGIPGNVCP